MAWINDRPPTEADSDSNGCVVIQRFPNTDESTVLHWSLVKPGLKWKHAPNWHKNNSPSPIALRCLSGNTKQRKFASISVADGCYIAIADDDTAWVTPDPSIPWTQFKQLPT